MKFSKSRRFIGILSMAAVFLFVSNPEIFALSFLISSIGIDVFLLFLSFQLQDQFRYISLLIKNIVIGSRYGGADSKALDESITDARSKSDVSVALTQRAVDAVAADGDRKSEHGDRLEWRVGKGVGPKGDEVTLR